MTHLYWPLFDLRLGIADLELRPMTEADLASLADHLPGDLEQDPAATTYDVADARVRRGIVVHQCHWKHYGTWRPKKWRLNFVVRKAGDVIGVQERAGRRGRDGGVRGVPTVVRASAGLNRRSRDAERASR